MGMRVVKNTLAEDLAKLGMAGFEDVQAKLAGNPMVEEDLSGESGEEQLDEGKKYYVLVGKSEKSSPWEVVFGDYDREVVEDEKGDERGKWKSLKVLSLKSDAQSAIDAAVEKMNEEYEEEDDFEVFGEGVDPLEAPDVNYELFDAIMNLPFDMLSAEDIDEVLDALKEKNLPDDAESALHERAEEVVDFLVSEGVAKRGRRFKAGSMAKRMETRCTKPGERKDPKDPSGRRCIRAAKAVGSAGKLMKQKRTKRRWSLGGSGALSARKSGRWADRREDVSPFAMELAGLMEERQEEVQMTVRDEILERIGSIVYMVSEEFSDESVNRIFDEAIDELAASLDAGRLDEDVMDEDEFIAEIKPILTLVHKSLERISGEEELGN